VRGNQRTALDVKVRFLHVLAREIGELNMPLLQWQKNAAPEFRFVPSLEAGGQVFRSWQEANEREVNAQGLTLEELAMRPRQFTFSFPAQQKLEPLSDSNGQIAGLILRRHEAINGAMQISAALVGERLFRVTARILNLTPFENPEATTRDAVLMCSLVSAHTILGAREGEFISLLDPPEDCRKAAAACQNIGTWPVLAGVEPERDLMLSSPIILYDYPQIAPESAGDLFDGAEIDEILTLRIMTLTDEEKREVRQADDRARRILERTEMLPEEQLIKLHGAWRSLRSPGSG
jgi:hydrogenase maturation protease